MLLEDNMTVYGKIGIILIFLFTVFFVVWFAHCKGKKCAELEYKPLICLSSDDKYNYAKIKYETDLNCPSLLFSLFVIFLYLWILICTYVKWRKGKCKLVLFLLLAGAMNMHRWMIDGYYFFPFYVIIFVERQETHW